MIFQEFNKDCSFKLSCVSSRKAIEYENFMLSRMGFLGFVPEGKTEIKSTKRISSFTKYFFFIFVEVTILDCAESYELKLGTLGATKFPEAEGTYQRICQDSDDHPIYQLVNGSYILRFVSSQPPLTFWSLYDNILATVPKMFKSVEAVGPCPGPETGSTPWFALLVSIL